MTRLSRVCVLGAAAVVAIAASAAMAKDAAKADTKARKADAKVAKTDAKAGAGAASRPAEFWKNLWNRMPAPIDQTITRQNSPQDKLRIDVTHSYLKEGKHVALVRVVWGDLDNLIKGGGREYYSNWDGKVTLDNGTGLVIHKIAFDDREGLVRRPALKDGGAATKPARDGAKGGSPIFKPTAEKPIFKPEAKVADKAAGRGEPRDGSGRDELDQREGKEIVWQAGVVGALDGLMIKITSDTADITGTIVAGKHTVPLKITGAPQPAKTGRKLDKATSPKSTVKGN